MNILAEVNRPPTTATTRGDGQRPAKSASSLFPANATAAAAAASTSKGLNAARAHVAVTRSSALGGENTGLALRNKGSEPTGASAKQQLTRTSVKRTARDTFSTEVRRATMKTTARVNTLLSYIHMYKQTARSQLR